MHKLKQDQAAGLRRLMATPSPRIISMLSATSSQDKSRLMTNLAASIASQDNKTIVIHASKESSESVYGINSLPTLLDANAHKHGLGKALFLSQHGFAIAKLMQKSQLHQWMSKEITDGLGQLLLSLSNEFEVVLVDASIDENGNLPLSTLNQGEIIVQLTRKPESIKDGYALIKKITNQLGTRQFGIIVDDATESQAQIVFNNMSKVAKQYIQTELTFFGAIPNDDHLGKAMQLGRSVVEAFPLASASTAFKKMAIQLEKQSHSHYSQAAFN